MIEKTFIRLIFVVSVMVLFSGCATINMFKTVDLQEEDLSSAYYERSGKGGEIIVGMSFEEVRKIWGDPSGIYQAKRSEYRYGADEFWVYSINKDDSQRMSSFYKVFFRDKKVIKIVKTILSERFVGIQDL